MWRGKARRWRVRFRGWLIEEGVRGKGFLETGEAILDCGLGSLCYYTDAPRL